MIRIPPVAIRLAFVLLVLAVASCGGGPKRKLTYPTDGKLLIDGKPVGNVTVFFQPVGTDDKEPTRAFATTNPDGTFSLTTYDANDGAPEGDYIITLLYEPLDSPLARAKGKPPKIDKIYTDMATSPLRAKIEKKPKNQLEPFDAK